MLIVDAHEDLAYNALVDGRDYLRSALSTRASEAGGPVPEVNGLCMLGLPEWLQAGVAVIFATVTTIPRSHAHPGEMSYPNVEASHQQAIAQLNIYRHWAATHPQISLITHRQHLEGVLQSWSDPQTPDARQIGLVLLMENADSIRDPDELGFWYEQGLRLIGPAWHSNRYSGSTKEPGPLTELGRRLLARMEEAGMVLDITHMAEEACLDALERYGGLVIASHANPRRLVPSDRMLSDTVIERLVARDGIVGIMPASWALDPAWRKPKTKADIHLEAIVEAIDVVCEIAGDARHVGIGTDFDGGFGAEATPAEIDTVADLPLLADALSRRGYAHEDIDAIMSGNWLRLLRQHLPDQVT